MNSKIASKTSNAADDAADDATDDAADDAADARSPALATIAWGALAALVAGVVLASRAGGDSEARAERPRFAPPQCRIDLSTAPVEELALLPEVGPSLAARIAADRATRGPYATVDDVVRVRGIGAHTLAELRLSARTSAP